MLPRPASLRHDRVGRPPVWLSRNGVTARRGSLVRRMSLRGGHSGGAEPEGWPGGPDGAVGDGDGEGAVRLQGETPATFVCAVVVLAAERKELVEIGRAAVFPVVHMVRFRELERHATTGHGGRSGTSLAGRVVGAREARRVVRPRFISPGSCTTTPLATMTGRMSARGNSSARPTPGVRPGSPNRPRLRHRWLRRFVVGRRGQ